MRLGSAAAYDVRARFSADGMTDAIQDLYDELQLPLTERLGERLLGALLEEPEDDAR